MRWEFGKLFQIKVLVSASLEDLQNFIQMFLIVSAGRKNKKKEKQKGGGEWGEIFFPCEKISGGITKILKAFVCTDHSKMSLPTTAHEKCI